eukprot:scaffold1311_cov256-Pinguiococcus_pyrenoidosus.AAC.39
MFWDLGANFCFRRLSPRRHPADQATKPTRQPSRPGSQAAEQPSKQLKPTLPFPFHLLQR